MIKILAIFLCITYSFAFPDYQDPINSRFRVLKEIIYQKVDDEHRLLERNANNSLHDGHLIRHFNSVKGNDRLAKRFSFHIPEWVKSRWPFHSKKTRFPDIKDPETILELAKLSSDVYTRQDEFEWYDVINEKYSVEQNFGWDNILLRGYVFADAKKDIIIIAFKGTSQGYLEKNHRNDQIMDNHMFSCCCGGNQCGCAIGKNQCSTSCIHENVRSEKSSYFAMAQKIFANIKREYPHASLWVTGHSLGGAVASLLSVVHGIPAIAFSSPGELQYAKRLGLIPENTNLTQLMQSLPIYHFANTHDPVFHGKCKGFFSLCRIGGFFLETKCHIGKVSIYNELSYRGMDLMNARKQYDTAPKIKSNQLQVEYHSVDFLIKNYLETWDYVPEMYIEKDCYDCSEYTFES